MASPKVSLYLLPGACSIVPQILLHHTGISYTPIAVTLKEMYTGKFTKTNPKGQVPVLDINGEIVTEVAAISHAINHMAPDAKIMGRSPMELVRVCEWLSFLSGAIHAQVWGAYIRPKRFTDEPAGEEAVKRQAHKKLRDRFAMVESKLDANRWAVGEGFTVVDAFLLPLYQWGSDRAGIDLKTDCPKWTALLEKIRKIDAVNEALAEEQRIQQETAT